jgi:hypothetical protein
MGAPPSVGGALRLPADHGLSGLGLVMQMFGGLFTAFMASMTMFFLIVMMQAGGRGGGKELMYTFLILGSSVVRSVMHYNAGKRLLYEGPGTPASAMKKYLIVAAIQTAVVCGVLSMMELPGAILGMYFLVLAAWPIALAVLALPALAQHSESVPMGEDKGFEGAAILMMIFGCIGMGIAAIFLFSWTEMGPAKSKLIGIGILVTCIMLVIRAIFHVRAGYRGISEVHLDRAVEAATKYADFGVIASFVAGGAFLLGFMAEAGGAPGAALMGVLTFVVMLTWMLLVWPLVVRKFFSERQFADLLGGGNVVHHRAPDQGLTSLGWFLVAMGAFTIAQGLGAVLVADSMGGRGMRGMGGGGNPLGMLMGAMGPMTEKSPWWGIGAAAFQLWAGIELVKMTPRYKIIATAYGVVASLVAIYINLDMLKAMLSHGFAILADNPQAVIAFIMVALALVIPITTLILVNRKPGHARAAARG